MSEIKDDLALPWSLGGARVCLGRPHSGEDFLDRNPETSLGGQFRSDGQSVTSVGFAGVLAAWPGQS
ncbi:MAG TPA: hypothetical protein VMI73_12465 [Trebonia sp.]|nr:hypothetical protein [Trebonia sp.]